MRVPLGLRWVVLALCVSACGIVGGPKIDETANWSMQKLYSEAKDEMSAGNWTAAVGLLEKLESRYPFGPYAQQAQLDMAYAYYKDGENEQAINAIDRFIRLHPDHAVMDYALYLKGIVNFNSNAALMPSITQQDPGERDPKAARAAFDAFNELIRRYPDSKYAKDATERMNYLVNTIASGEVNVARYYFNRGAYLAAANRAQAVAQNFQQAPATEEALYILVRSYEALGMDQLRDDAERVLKASFPQSVLLTTGFTPHRTPWWQVW